MYSYTHTYTHRYYQEVHDSYVLIKGLKNQLSNENQTCLRLTKALKQITMDKAKTVTAILNCDQEAALSTMTSFSTLPTFTLGSISTCLLNFGMRNTNFFSLSSDSNLGNPCGIAVYSSSSIMTLEKGRQIRNRFKRN